ncbi:MAG: lipocalin family protein [Bacteroidales bacterium]|jgi:lipocalin|nr:lipocalin family protein [Bacteroidales bacterium]MDD2824838.1 lipocalin family protein [Bacteroidales bacterium]MDD3100128.1 lipocalin family protein [Bacteroidales bacterium]MDD3639267.1 lipocalin family protein [Bacteroidales bacterium]MDD4481105.1 lipocalin family protein [Bacteroidales bacterium]
MKIMSIILSCTALLLAAGCKAENPEFNVTIENTVQELDLDRYLGKWYEIARFDHSFERGLVGATANYSITEDGKIKVVNTGYKDSFDGKFNQAEAKAYRPDENYPGALRVSFFLFFYSDYWVLDLDEDYTFALVGSKSSKYLWILSRTPEMAPADLQRVLNKAVSLGYNTGNLIWVEQR